MATIHNQRRLSNYPISDMFNKRENRLVDYANTVAVLSAESLALDSVDGIRFIRNSGTSTVTLPEAAANKGRMISFLQVDANYCTKCR